MPEPDPKPQPSEGFYVSIDRIRKAPGRPTEAGPDSNETRGDKMSRFTPEQGLTATRSAAAPDPRVTKGITPDSFAGHGMSKPDDSPLSNDPEYQRALKTGDSATLARIAHKAGRKQ